MQGVETWWKRRQRTKCLVVGLLTQSRTEALMSFLGNSGLYIVNGRMGRDGFTCMCVRKREFSSGLLHTPKGTV